MRSLFNKAISFSETNNPWDKIIVVNRNQIKHRSKYERFFGENIEIIEKNETGELENNSDQPSEQEK